MAAPRGRYRSVLDGFAATVRVFDKYIKEIEQVADEQMEYWAHKILNRSLYYCPTSEGSPWPPEVHPGYLRSTGQAVQEGLGKWMIVYSAWYAAYVHENPPSFNYHRPPTRWKFLEIAADEVTREMIKEMPGNLGVFFRSIGTQEQTLKPALLESQWNMEAVNEMAKTDFAELGGRPMF